MRPHRSRAVTEQERVKYQRRLDKLDWTQRHVAVLLHRNPGVVSAWITGQFSSRPLRDAFETLLDREEAARRAQKLARRAQKLAEKTDRAHRRAARSHEPAPPSGGERARVPDCAA